MRFTIVAAFGLLLTGCVTVSTSVMNADGKIVDCSAKGGGFGLGFFVGLGAAESLKGNCVDNAARLGFVPIKDAGTIAIDLTDTGTGLSVSRVRGGSTAEKAGVVAGDTLAAIEGTKPANIAEAKRLLFGKTGTEVNVTLHTAGRDLNLKVQREPFGKATGLTT